MPSLSPKTIATYGYALNGFFKKQNIEFRNKENYNIVREKLLKPEEVQEFITERYDKLNTHRLIYNAILHFLREDDNDNENTINVYIGIVAKYNNTIRRQERKQEKSEKQEENWFTIEEAQKFLRSMKYELRRQRVWKKEDLRKTLFRRDIQEAQKYMIGCCYLLDDENPPLRNEYSNMKLIQFADYEKLPKEELESNNYLVIKNSKSKFFHLSVYKTVGRYGIKNIPVGNKLNAELNIWLSINKDNTYLFQSQQGNPYQSSRWSLLVKDAMQELRPNITSGLMRHVFISEKFPANLEEREKYANLMCHSTTVQECSYAKK